MSYVLNHFITQQISVEPLSIGFCWFSADASQGHGLQALAGDGAAAHTGTAAEQDPGRAASCVLGN